MGIFDKIKNQFDSSELKSKKSHIRNLYAIAMADGRLENSEFEFILQIGQRKLFLDGETIRSVINNIEDVSFYVPKTINERLNLLEDYVKITIIDGNINQNEINVCKQIAINFGFRPVVIDKLFNHILNNIAHGIAKDLALKKALDELR
jgi:uncharacterized tellurite resistance protein B-like protein